MYFAAQRVGRITVALGLVAFGIGLLIDNLTGTQDATGLIIKLWPLVLIGFGVEYLIRSVLAARRPEDAQPFSLKFDTGGTILLLLVVLLGVGITTLHGWVAEGTGRLTFIGGPSYSRNDSLTVRLDGTQELQLDVVAGWIKLQQHNVPNEIRVEATYTAHGFILNRETVERALQNIRLRATEGRVVRIWAELPGDLNNITLGYTIYAPPNLKVKAETKAGWIQVTDYRGDMDLRSNAGRIEVAAGAGSLVAGSNAGTISVHGFEGPVVAKATVGSLDMQNILGPLQLDSGTGSINVRQFQGGKLVAETRTGGVHVYTGAVLEGDVILRAAAGSVRLEVPGESSMRVTAQTRAGPMTLPPFMTSSQNGPARTGVGTNLNGKHAVTLEAGTGSITFALR